MDNQNQCGQQVAPRLAFLGFCNGVTEMTDATGSIRQINVLGLSPVLASYIFPFSLRGQRMILALYNPRPGEQLTIKARPMLHPDQPIVFSIVPEVVSPGGVAPPALAPGWHITPIEIGDLMVLQPDSYNLHQVDDGLDLYLGTFHLAACAVPPWGPEEVAAIRSDPFAAKLVRVEFGCKSCDAKFRAYTGLERNPALESQGYTWQFEVPQRFRCDCGSTVFDLSHLRNGMHGLLRKLSRPESSSSIVDTVRLYQGSALEESCRRLKRLIDSQVREEEVQVFLENNPVFFASFVARKLMVKKPVLSKYVVDFALLNQRNELVLIEIERPGIPLTKKDGGITADLQHALDQVRSWLQVFTDHRGAALECFGLKLEEVARVKGVVIAGRTPQNEDHARHLRASGFQDIELFTYDDMVKGVAELARHLAST